MSRPVPQQAPGRFSAPRRGFEAAFSGLPSKYWWLWTSTLINRLGSFVVIYLAMYLTTRQGYSAAAVGFVVSLYGLGGVLSSLVAGTLSDLFGRRVMLLGVQLGSALMTILLAFAVTPVSIAIFTFMVGLFGNALRPIVQVAMADLTPDSKQRSKAFALNYWATNVGFGVSSMVGGVLAGNGYRLLFFADAATTLLAAVLVFLRVPESKPRTPEITRTETASGAKAGTSQVLRDPRFMMLTVLTFMIASLLQQANTTLPVDMARRGLSSTDYGAVFALNGLLIVFLQIPVSHITGKFARRLILPGAALFMGWGFGLNALAGPVEVYAVATVMWTLGEMVIFPTSVAAVAEFAPANARGSYQGVYASAVSAASLIAPLAGGWGLENFGRITIWLASAVIGTTVALGYSLLFGRAKFAAPALRRSGAAPKLAQQVEDGYRTDVD